MREAPTVEALRQYLDYAGILACNENPYLKCLEDIGCGWSDVMALIDAHGLFLSKVYRGRTTYLSNEVYFLLKRVRKPKPMDADAATVYELLQQEPMDKETLRLLSGLDKKRLDRSLQFLLQNLYVTALESGKELNPNWSTLRYGTAEAWEAYVTKPSREGGPRERLIAILTQTMPEKEIVRLLK